jgi:hypothetical protein
VLTKRLMMAHEGWVTVRTENIEEAVQMLADSIRTAKQVIERDRELAEEKARKQQEARDLYSQWKNG